MRRAHDLGFLFMALAGACQPCTVPAALQYGSVFPIDPYTVSLRAPSCALDKHDVIIVLGCPANDDGSPSSCQMQRADLAVALVAKGYASELIVSGAAVANAYVEADVLHGLLVARGIDERRIIDEPRAEHTDENIYYSSLLMRAHHFTRALVVSDDPGHLIYTAICDSDCCVQLGRLTVYDYPIATGRAKVGDYTLETPPSHATRQDCAYVSDPKAALCLNFAKRRACAGNLMLPP